MGRNILGFSTLVKHAQVTLIELLFQTVAAGAILILWVFAVNCI